MIINFTAESPKNTDKLETQFRLHWLKLSDSRSGKPLDSTMMTIISITILKERYLTLLFIAVISRAVAALDITAI